MPYIDQITRENLQGTSLRDRPIIRVLDPGELNYLLTRFTSEWLGPNPNYARYNAALGVLEAVKQELYRRQVAPYEDTKREANGDVY